MLPATQSMLGTRFRTMAAVHARGVLTGSSRAWLNASRTSISSCCSITTTSQVTAPKYELSQKPELNASRRGQHIKTAAALIIGDEILNGKTLDRNSNYFACYCFEHGVQLKRIEVIPDIEQQIVEASRRMVQEYDLVITTGGIGPTHDDITYSALATAFSQPLVHHAETQRRMDEMNKSRAWAKTMSPEQQEASQRMALFPERAEVLYVTEDLWVPVVRLEGKLCVFPGIPSLFRKLLDGLTPYLPLPPLHLRPQRIQIFTERPESMIAPYLSSLQRRLRPAGIQVGSYPAMGQGVFVSLIGRRDVADDHQDQHVSDPDGQEKLPNNNLREIASEVERAIEGSVFNDAEVTRLKQEGKRPAKRNVVV